MMKEYGGYLPLELPRRKEYFSEICSSDLLRLNCGRSTFYCAGIDAGIKKIYVPYLNCEYSVLPFEQAGIAYEFYRLKDDLTPKDVFPKDKEAVLWINYYGNAKEEQKEKVLSKYKTVIIDNCHAFFTKPVLRQGVYNCYSARKFFGVADGAYLIKRHLSPFKLKDGYSHENSNFLMKTIELGTNAVYQDSLVNEDNIAENVSNMSPLTKRILSSINYEEIKEIRKRNFLKLHASLESLNEFQVNTESDTHMYYPLLVTNDELRDRVIENHIYTPTWWRHVPALCNFEGIETTLAKYMLMLPMDQRYMEADMEDISNIIKRNI